jgi:hypothetical protein
LRTATAIRPNRTTKWANTWRTRSSTTGILPVEGSDYASTQWFQEGFTEYVANLTLVSGKIVDADAFAAKLGEHVNNYRRLTTTLERSAPEGTAPLQCRRFGGLFVGRDDSSLRRSAQPGRLLPEPLAKRTAAPANTWADIRSALQSTADADWEGFYQAHIKAAKRCRSTRCRDGRAAAVQNADGTEQVAPDPAAPASARSL